MSFINKYFGQYSLPTIDGLTFDTDNFLTAIRFSEMPGVMEGPLVSVVMSAHNSAKTIEYAVRSILSQTYKNLELLVCDDGSDDETLDDVTRVFRKKISELKLTSLPVGRVLIT